MNTLPNFTSVFLYGRWSQDNEFFEIMKNIGMSAGCETISWTECPRNLSEDDEEEYPKGYLFVMDQDQDPPGNYDMTLSDINYLIECIRHNIKYGMSNTQIESFKWEGTQAFIELSCL